MRALALRLILFAAAFAFVACGPSADTPTAPVVEDGGLSSLAPDHAPNIGKLDATGSVEVGVDIKPRVHPNQISRRPYGRLRVAIAGTNELDVRDIRRWSVRMMGVAPLYAFVRDVTSLETSSGAPIVLTRVNCGGPLIEGTPNWMADDNFTSSPYANTGFADASDLFVDTSHPSIPAGTPDAVFQSERYDGIADPDMTWELPVQEWDIPVNDGTQLVRLYFADRYAPAHRIGGRIFDVSIEGDLVLQDYDIFAKVGGFTGVVEEFTTQVSDGALTIDFGRNTQNPTICGIEVLSSGVESTGEPGGRDGIEDLILVFPKSYIMKAIGPVERGDVVELGLRGRMRDGSRFHGSDVVRIGFAGRDRGDD